jgi:hypothetical protein
VGYLATPPEIRFWRRVQGGDYTECWTWTGGLNAGYGKFQIGGKGSRQIAAHRYAYELLRAEIPEGLVLDHLCRNPACVNPWHLEPVPQAINVARGLSAKRSHCPKGHPYDEVNTYITPPGVRDCRACRRDTAARYRARRKAVK